jgi:hypothetical protein
MLLLLLLPQPLLLLLLLLIVVNAAGVGTPEQTYGVSCTVFPGNKRDLHGTPWLASGRQRRRVAPMNAATALDVNATCYNYRTQRGESVSSIVEWFDLDYRDFIQRNQRRFGNLQQVTYKLVQNKKEKELQRILEMVGSVTRPLTADNPYFVCKFFDKSGAASNVTCYAGATDKCAMNGTVDCTLRYRDVNVTEVLPASGCQVSNFLLVWHHARVSVPIT